MELSATAASAVQSSLGNRGGRGARDDKAMALLSGSQAADASTRDEGSPARGRRRERAGRERETPSVSVTHLLQVSDLKRFGVETLQYSAAHTHLLSITTARARTFDVHCFTFVCEYVQWL